MMGLPINDGRLIRPADEPKLAKAVFEWDVVLAESLTRRAELRKQKWVVKNREMQLLASKNLLLPQLDAIGLYRMRGFGKDWFDTGNHDNLGIFSSAWANLASAKFQEWQLGFEFSMPLGFRKGHVAVRNAELQVARERSILNEQERQVVLDLSNALAEVKRAEEVRETNYNRRVAAKQQLAALRAIEDPTPQMLYIELDAQRRLADATTQYYRSLIEYEIAVKNVHFEKGSILEYNGVYLAELPSPAKAYQDAYEKIKMRTRAARWAAEGASTRVVSEGLVPQAYAPAAVPPAGPSPNRRSLPGISVPEAPPAPPDPQPQVRRKSATPAVATASAEEATPAEHESSGDGEPADAESSPIEPAEAGDAGGPPDEAAPPGDDADIAPLPDESDVP
jgi:hypothetical protein